MMNKKQMRTALALGLVFLPATAFAVGEIENTEIVISATKTEKTIQEAPATIAVVDADTSAEYGNNSIADMVKDIPGVEVVDTGAAGSKRLMIRGEAGGRVITLIDGQKINEQKAMSGAPLLIDPASVERIEIVKGAGSVLYGSEAMGGVINIITKKGGEKPFGGTIAGGFNTGTSGKEGSLSIHGGTENIRYRVTGSYSDQGDRKTPKETLEDSDSLAKSLSGFLGYQNDWIDAGITLESYDVDVAVPPFMIMGNPFDLDLPEWTREKVGVYADFMDINNFIAKIHLDAYYQTTFRDFYQDWGFMAPNPAVPPFPPVIPIDYDLQLVNDQETYALNAQIDMTPSASHYLIAGLAYSNDSLEAVTDEVFTPNIPGRLVSNRSFQEASLDTWALYLQDEWNLTNDLTLTLGVRQTWVDSELEKNINNPRLRLGSVSDNNPAFSVGLTWNTTDELTLRALFSQGYRFPDLNQLYTGTFHGMETTFPNPNLKPETSNNFEAGLRFDNDQLKTDIALFYNEAKNYIAARPFGPRTNRFENVDTAKTMGLEMWLSYRFEPYNLTPYLSATLMRRKFENNLLDTWNTNTPFLNGRMGIKFEHPLASMPVTLWGDLYLRAATDAKEEKIERGRLTVTTKDGWSTLNLALGARWGENERWKASINFNNIFDESYTTAQNLIMEPGFNIVGRLSFDF